VLIGVRKTNLKQFISVLKISKLMALLMQPVDNYVHACVQSYSIYRYRPNGQHHSETPVSVLEVVRISVEGTKKSAVTPHRTHLSTRIDV